MRFDSNLAWLSALLLLLAGCAPRGAEALRRGDEALSANQPAEAVPLLERAVTDLPTDALAWNHLGLAYQGTGRAEEARKAYLRALQFDRNLFDVYFNLGALEYESGRWADSERALRTYLGVEANRSNVTAWRMLAEAQLASNQWDVAERTLATALQLAPNDPALHHSLGLTLARKRRWREAQAQFAQVLRLAPETASARLNLAVATQQLGDRRGALEHYRAFLLLNPPTSESEAVSAQIQQLESALAPQPIVSTNVVSTRTNPLTNNVRSGPATNPTVASVTRTTNPPAYPATNATIGTAAQRNTAPPPTAVAS
ncbi:MAG TPA: tetratricopeptide repeat protein, partial [Verrucomicrobiota bacterium]|nr:tetratricopeptide repeat protein [Verrucomicrobiota bacterium]